MPAPSTTRPPDRPVARATEIGVLLVGLLAGAAAVAAIVGAACAAVPAAVAAVLAALATTRTRRRDRGVAAPVALLDAVTGVPGREALTRHLGVELARARRHGTPLTVLHVDLAGFGALSERIGREPTNELLRRTALGMAASLRGEDLVGRRGTDSFVVLLPGLSGDDVTRVIARLGAAAGRVRVEGVHVDPLHVDVGVARFPQDAETVQELLATAQTRLGATRDARLRVGVDAGAGDGDGGAAGAPPDEPVVGDRWRLGRALAIELAAAALLVPIWFALPLVTDASASRMVLVTALALASCAAAAVVGRHTGGRERIGWWLIAAAAPISVIPYAGSGLLVVFACAILLIAGDGWLRDRFRILDALMFSAIVVGGIEAFALPGHAAWIATSWGVHLSVVVRVIGASTAGATVLLILTCVPRRERPDVWLLAAGYVALVSTQIAVIHSGGVWAMPSGWRVVSVFPAINLLTIAWLRLRHPAPVSRVLRDGDGDGTVVSTAGIAGFVGLMGATALTHGSIPLAVVAALVVIALIRHARSLILALDNRRLVSVALRSQAERSAQHHASLLALTAALEARDGYTGRHGEETTSLTSQVAEALGLPADERREIDTVALLHDVGKIGTPNEILHKDGPLTEEEWVVMREHPVVGERILRQVPGFEAVATAVRHEHERWDGSGYPDGISGEEIPLASRIVLVCDAYHAMTSDRPYRRAMPIADAIAELERHAGTQFDPAVVRALVGLLRADDLVVGPGAYQAAA
jgi:diguanylate cyclase (GGDEF)-like protein